ncbi:MAG: squalene--hopene cyclase, partial [Planctomycetaceae bacterium]
LPFDRSAPDLTAHALRALQAAGSYLQGAGGGLSGDLAQSLGRARQRGLRYLAGTQRADGAWLPLWFGNQNAPDDENATYGTAKVLAAWRDWSESEEKLYHLVVPRARDWLVAAQNPDGGFGAGSGTESSVEETALAVEALTSLPPGCPVPRETIVRGLTWLERRVHEGNWREPSPIGFYFAKLWYFEKLYPLLFCAAAVRRGRDWLRREAGSPAE